MNAFLEPTAQDRAYEHVKELILSFSLQPGQWIKAQDIASVVKTSRTPVREALSRLEQEGFVRRDGGWGYVVQSISLQEARDFYKVREALEAEAVREAVAHITPQHLQVLEGLLRKAEQACARGRLAVFRTNSRGFHEQICRIAGNALLAKLLSQLQDRMHLLAAMVFEKHATRMDEVVQENRAILAALAERDVARAESAARRHVQRAWRTYVRHVAGGAPADMDIED